MTKAEKNKHPLFLVWYGMRRRCTDPKIESFKYYGERGITVCERWQNSFENFVADMGERPAGTSLDRINNEGNYEPSNCRWATPLQQSNNRRPNSGHHRSRAAKAAALKPKTMFASVTEAVDALIDARLLLPRTPGEMRAAIGLRRDELATKAGVSLATIARIEQGTTKTEFDMDVLNKVAACFPNPEAYRAAAVRFKSSTLRATRSKSA